MSNNMDNNNSQLATPKGTRIIITTGEVKGIMDIQKAKLPSGSFITALSTTIDKISGTMIGSINCCVSASLSTAEPTVANNAA